MTTMTAVGLAELGAYVRTQYRVPACINRRIRFDWHGGKTGTIVGFDGEGAYLHVQFDGEDRVCKLHPTWNITYLDNPLWTEADQRPDGVDRFRAANGEHWVATEPGGAWFRCEERDYGQQRWTHVGLLGPVGDAAVVDGGPPDPDRLQCGVLFTHRTDVGRLVQLTRFDDRLVWYLYLDQYGQVPRTGRIRSGPRRRDGFERDFMLYRPCRWTMECLAQATVTILFEHLGAVPACDGHAADHLAWEAQPWQKRGWEPEPECMCPDSHRLNGMIVEYCPRCGEGPSRGTDIMEHDKIARPTVEATQATRS